MASRTKKTKQEATVTETQTTTKSRDQVLEDQRQAELAADREEHNRRTGGGAHPLSTERQ